MESLLCVIATNLKTFLVDLPVATLRSWKLGSANVAHFPDKSWGISSCQVLWRLLNRHELTPKSVVFVSQSAIGAELVNIQIRQNKEDLQVTPR
jgi:hypothetical protein